MVAVHGDEGDDQHGLNVHAVHDMQPGMPCQLVEGGAASALLPRAALQDLVQQAPPPAKSLSRSSQMGMGARECVLSGASRSTDAATAAGAEADAAAALDLTQSTMSISSATHQQHEASDASPALAPAAPPGQTLALPPSIQQQQAQEIPLSAEGSAAMDLNSVSGHDDREHEGPQVQLRQPSQALKMPTLQPDQHQSSQQPACGHAPTAQTQTSDSASLCPELHGEVMHALCPAGPQSQDMGTAKTGDKQQQTETDQHTAQLASRAQSLAAIPAATSHQSQPAELQYEQAVGMHDRIKAMLRHKAPGGGRAGAAEGEEGTCTDAQAMTQVEVIEAQIPEQEKPQAITRSWLSSSSWEASNARSLINV